MGASALEKKGRGGDRRGTKRLRSALVNGNGSVVGEAMPKKHANGLNGGAVSTEPLGGAEHKEAKLGRSFSDATIASMPLKKRKLQLMMAMMEEETPEVAVAESPRANVLANVCATKAEPEATGEGRAAAEVVERGEAKVTKGSPKREGDGSDKAAGDRSVNELGGLASVALDVLAGVAAIAGEEILHTGSPILKAPVKGKRNGGRRARFGGERNSRETSTEKSVEGVEKDVGICRRGEAEESERSPALPKGVQVGEGIRSGQDGLHRLGESRPEQHVEQGLERREVDDAEGQGMMLDERPNEGDASDEVAGAAFGVQEEADQIAEEADTIVDRSEPEESVQANGDLGSALPNGVASEVHARTTTAVTAGEGAGIAVVEPILSSPEAGVAPEDAAAEESIQEGEGRQGVPGPLEDEQRAEHLVRDGGGAANLLQGVDANGSAQGLGAIMEDGVEPLEFADLAVEPALEDVRVETPEWDANAGADADGNLSPVSEDGGGWGADDAEENVGCAGVGEGNSNADRKEEERADGKREAESTDSGEAKAGRKSEVKELVREPEMKPDEQETSSNERGFADGPGMQAETDAAAKSEAPKEAFVKRQSSSGQEGDLDNVIKGGEEKGPVGTPEVEAPQTSLAAAVSSAVAAAAAQGAGDSARHKEGGWSEDQVASDDKTSDLRGGRNMDGARGPDPRIVESGKGSAPARTSDSLRGSDGGPPPPARRVVDSRRFGGSSREGSRERREDADRWEDLDRRDERGAPYRREFPSRGIPRGGPDYHQGWGGSGPGYAPKGGWASGIRRVPLAAPPSLNAAAAAAARLQSTGFVVNPDGTISKVPEPLMGARTAGMYGAGGLRRIGGPGGVPRAVLAYPGMGGPPGMGGLVGPVTRPVMLVPGRGLVEVPYPGPRPMLAGPPLRYPPPGWRRGRSPSPPQPARPPPPRGSYHGVSPARGRSRSRSRSPPPPRNRDYNPGFRTFERTGSRSRGDLMRDPSPPPPRVRTPPSKKGDSISPPGDSFPPSRRNRGSSPDSDFGSGGKNSHRRSVSPVRRRGGSNSRDDSRSPPPRRRDVSGSPLDHRSPPRSRREESRERDGKLRRDDGGRSRNREGSYNRDSGERSSRRHESSPPRRRPGGNGSIGSALMDDRDRMMLEAAQRG